MREPFVFIRSLFGLRAGLNLSIKALEQRLTSRTNLLRIFVHENGIESANTLFFFIRGCASVASKDGKAKSSLL